MKINPKYEQKNGESKEYNYEYKLKTISIDYETQDILSELSKKLGVKKYIILRRAVDKYIIEIKLNSDTLFMR